MYVCMYVCMYERRNIMHRYYCIVNIYVCKKVCEYIYALQTFGVTSNADHYVCMYVCMYVGAAQPKAGTILVPVTTIDKFCDERKIQEVDIIKVDAEGNDIAGLLIYCMCLYMYVCMYVCM